MTEIPEHLLKRSRERRSAIGKGGDDAGSSDTPADSGSGAATPATTTPATPAAAPAPTGPAARSAAPEPAAPEPPKPDPVYVQAAKQRRKVPWWAMATLSLMPVWGFMYWRALTETNEAAEGPIGLGAEIYSNCASCHGGGGEGGVGYAFTGGEVILTYPNIEDQLRYVYYGTEQYNIAEVQVPGDPDREGGAHVTGELGNMPGFAGQITDYQLLAVVCHERYTLGGADPSSEEFAEEFEQFCSEESPVFAALQAGEISLDMDSLEPFVGASGDEFTIDPVGSAPIEGGGP